MAHRTRIQGTAYEITGGKTRVNGTAYEIAGGRTKVNGAAYDIPFETYRPVLNDNSWSAISNASLAGIAPSLWSVGDDKAVEVSGTIQRLPIHQTLWVYILGFDHNAAVEGLGIHFGCFLSAQKGGVELCLADDRYGTGNQGAGYAAMNFYTAEDEFGPWYQCRMRLDVLGSSDVPYGTPTPAAPISPAPGTLMAALPMELRRVMQPMTKYTDNGGTFQASTNVGATTEYLPLPAEKEVWGSIYYGNQGEWRYQEQYDFYKLGLSTTRYRADAPQTAASFWTRSTSAVTEGYYVHCLDNAHAGHAPGSCSLGIAPVFKV